MEEFSNRKHDPNSLFPFVWGKIYLFRKGKGCSAGALPSPRFSKITDGIDTFDADLVNIFLTWKLRLYDSKRVKKARTPRKQGKKSLNYLN